jgi:hypothetical protein
LFGFVYFGTAIEFEYVINWPSLDVNTCPANREIQHFLWNLKFQYCVCESLLVYLVLNQMNCFCILTTLYFFKMHCNIICLSALRSPMYAVTFRLIFLRQWYFAYLLDRILINLSQLAELYMHAYYVQMYTHIMNVYECICVTGLRLIFQQFFSLDLYLFV